MIISFELGGEIIEVQVTHDRELQLMGRMTNNKFITFDQLVRASGQENNPSFELTKRIVKCNHCLRDNKDIEYYVIQEFLRNPEMQSAGIKHLKTTWQSTP